MVNDNGFIFKRRKRHRDADVAPLAMKDGQPEEDAKRVAKVTLNLAKKKQMLLSTKARSELWIVAAIDGYVLFDPLSECFASPRLINS